MANQHEPACVPVLFVCPRCAKRLQAPPSAAIRCRCGGAMERPGGSPEPSGRPVSVSPDAGTELSGEGACEGCLVDEGLIP